MDSISDLLVRMQSMLKMRKESVDVPYSCFKEELLKILHSEGYIAKYEVHTRMNKKHLRIGFKYDGRKKGVISGLKRGSKPGRRIYVRAGEVPQVQSGFGTVIISTSKGLMTDNLARANKLGGEVICYVW